MKKKILILLLALLMLTGCAARQSSLSGRYTAVNPPVESGELVIQELEFDKDKVTMTSGSVSQTVPYKLKGETFQLVTNFGTYSYAFSQEEDGTLVIDGVSYKRQ